MAEYSNASWTTKQYINHVKEKANNHTDVTINQIENNSNRFKGGKQHGEICN